MGFVEGTYAAMPVSIKRAYDKPSRSDGKRVLVERVWPRGLGKESAMLDLWLPALGASAALEKSMRSPRALKGIMQRKYFAELCTPDATAALETLHALADRAKAVTLLYAGKDATQNPAAMLKDFLEGGRKPPNGSGPGRASAGTGQVRAMRKGK
jgi:uncharacterized protein YeaO (DUF488 family)